MTTTQLRSKRLRSGASDHDAREQRAADVIRLLQSRPDIAEHVLTAPGAYYHYTPATLQQICTWLPAELHASAMRGYFGAESSAWSVHACVAPELHIMRRVVLGLQHQPQVSIVRLSGPLVRKGGAHVLRALASATRVTQLQLTGDLKGCGSPEWPQALGALTWLRDLDIRYCELDPEAEVKLASVLADLDRLDTLVLHEYSMSVFAPALHALTALTSLELDGCIVCPASEPMLGEALRQMPGLQHLSLARTYAMRTGAMAHTLNACTALRTLSLARCDLGSKAGTESLLTELSELRGLKLDSNCDLGSAGLRIVLRSNALLHLTELTASLLAHTFFDPFPVDWVWPWQELCALTNLRNLSIACNPIGDDGAAGFAQHIHALVRLCTLDISHCFITAAGALGRAIVEMRSLCNLDCRQHVELLDPFVLPRSDFDTESDSESEDEQ